MADDIKVEELKDSGGGRDGRAPRDRLLFKVMGTGTGILYRDTVIEYVKAASPLVLERPWGDLPRQDIIPTADAIDEVNETGIWQVEVNYAFSDRRVRAPSRSDYSQYFDTSGGTEHITQSKKTWGAYARPGRTASNYQGAIGVTHDAVVGVDIPVKGFRFGYTYTLGTDIVTADYIAMLRQMSRCVGSKPWKGSAAGEVLFHGARGNQRGEEPWVVDFVLEGSPNKTNFMVGDILVQAKWGWDYLWVRYETEADTDSKRLIQVPSEVYVEQVFDQYDLAMLQIGT